MTLDLKDRIRGKLQDILQHELERYILKEFPALLLVVDREGQIHYANKYWSFLGWDYMLDENITDYLHPERVSGLDSLIRNRTGSNLISRVKKRKDGYATVNWTIQPSELDPQYVFVIGQVVSV